MGFMETGTSEKDMLRALYGENRRIADGAYDKSLAVKCVNGTFVGKKTDGVIAYKGIPFVGKQPSGEYRWKAPVDIVPDDGIYEAYYNAKSSYGNEALETGSMFYQDEDCLYLNVWKAEDAGTEKKPVMVWVHGGGFEAGGTVDPMFDCGNFLRENPDVIIVTIAYRLGAFGFLHLKHLPDGKDYQDAQNLGLLDQVMALKWVHENIASFGGDPENITIGGQSAGAGSVIFHIENPESRKYFKRAVVESGLFVNPFRQVFPTHTVEDAEKIGQEFFEFCGVKSLEEARNLPVETLQKKWSDWGGFFKSAETWAPIYDGNFMRGDIIERIEKDGLEVPPLLIGFTKDEFFDAPVQGSDEGKISTVELGLWKLIKAEEKRGVKSKNFVYKFDVPIPGWDNPGDFHSVDLWFFFETLAKCWRPFNGMHYDMARHICDYLCNFIKTGNPNDCGKTKGGIRYTPVKDEFKKREAAESEKLPEWKPFSSDNPECMFFETECRSGKLEASDDMKKYAQS